MSQWRQLDKRPTGITVVTILQVISGIVILVTAGLLISHSSEDQLSPAFSNFVGVIIMVIGLFYLYVAFGLFKGKGWAWNSMIRLQELGTPLYIALSIAFGGANALFTPINGLIGVNILLAIVIVTYMLKPKTRAYFGKARL